MKKIFFLISLLFLLYSCKPDNTAVDVSDYFMKTYYQQMNQEEAIKYSGMMAKDKLQKEIELLKSARSQNPNLSATAAKVTFKLEESKNEKEFVFLTYKLTVQPKGIKPYERTAIITASQDKGEWKVINYEEI